MSYALRSGSKKIRLGFPSEDNRDQAYNEFLDSGINDVKVTKNNFPGFVVHLTGSLQHDLLVRSTVTKIATKFGGEELLD